MATRPCPRCSKSVPTAAAFCRRCGHCLIDEAGRPFGAAPTPPHARPAPPPKARPAPGRWPGFVVTTAVAALAAVLGLFTASLPPATSRLSDPGPPREADPGTDVGAAHLARMSEHLAEARARVRAARERLATAPGPSDGQPDWRGSRRVARMLSAAPGRGDEATQAEPMPLEAATPGRVPPADARKQGPAPTAGQETWPTAATPQSRLRRPQTMRDVARANVVRAGGPSITGFSEERGAAGERVAVDGRGFAGTSRVVFAAPATAGRAWSDAAFRVRDDGRLIATVPDLGPSERPATVIVVTPRGAAVTVSQGATLVSVEKPRPAPDGGAGLHYLAAGATLSPPRGAVVVVDRGAAVWSAAGSLVVVRAGGGVERARADCLIVRETPRPEARDLAVVPVLDVPLVNTCFVESPFYYAGH